MAKRVDLLLVTLKACQPVKQPAGKGQAVNARYERQLPSAGIFLNNSLMVNRYLQPPDIRGFIIFEVILNPFTLYHAAI